MIAGFPKCGTTSLYYWLNAIDGFSGSTPKEPHFFNDTADWMCPRVSIHSGTMKDYSEYFDQTCSAEHGVKHFEASTRYLYQTSSASRIREELGQIRFIICMRDPLDRLVSNYGYFKDNKAILEPDCTLNDYVNLLLNGQPITGIAQIDDALSEGKYIEHISRWASVFGSDRMHFVFMEDMKTRPREVLSGVVNWLGGTGQNLDGLDFSSHNQTYNVKFMGLHKLLSCVGKLIPEGSGRDLAKKYYKMLNTFKQARSEVGDVEFARLHDYYIGSVRELEGFVGRKPPFRNF